MAQPPEEPAPEDAESPLRPALHLIEASEARERTCGECGKRTSAWKPVRRKGVPVLLCPECAAKPPPPEDACPRCGAPLEPHDAFCARCGSKIEYACPQCGAVLEADDAFCGRCGAQLV